MHTWTPSSFNKTKDSLSLEIMLNVPFTRRTHEWRQSFVFSSFYEPRCLEYVRALLGLLTKKTYSVFTQLALATKDDFDNTVKINKIERPNKYLQLNFLFSPSRTGDRVSQNRRLLLSEWMLGFRRKVIVVQHVGRWFYVLEPLCCFGVPLHHRAGGMLTIT